MEAFKEKVERLFQRHEELITRKNVAVEDGNGIFTRYKYPVVTAAHTPVFWRYDLDEKSNPYLMERIGMNATMNSGAIKWNGKYLMVVRVEGADRKSFFAASDRSEPSPPSCATARHPMKEVDIRPERECKYTKFFSFGANGA